MPRRGEVTAATARALRRQATSWESSLWRMLRNKRTGFHFRRQHRMAGYVLDFYCVEARLCVELDGSGHEQFHTNRDWIRDGTLEDLGVMTLRLTNDQVTADLHSCFFRIRDLCERRARELEPDRDTS